MDLQTICDAIRSHLEADGDLLDWQRECNALGVLAGRIVCRGWAQEVTGIPRLNWREIERDLTARILLAEIKVALKL